MLLVAGASLAGKPLRMLDDSGGYVDAGRALEHLAAAFRDLPAPVIGRVEDGAQILDLRCLEDEAVFTMNFAALDLGDDHEPA